MRIRDLVDTDLDRTWAINEAETPAVSSVTRDELAAIVHQSEIALVTEENGTVGGFCVVLGPGAEYKSPNYAWFAERYQRFIYLDRVAIAPEFQRLGWGHHLYAEVERRAAQLSPPREWWTLEVDLVPPNHKSLSFHAQLGFAQVGVRTATPDHSLSMMAKPLSPPGSASL